jgi:hypothetical protein
MFFGMFFRVISFKEKPKDRKKGNTEIAELINNTLSITQYCQFPKVKQS